MISVDDILRAVQNPRKTKLGWNARCPAHDDRVSSLSIAVGRNSRPIWFCHGGCSQAAVVHALGLSMAEVMVGADEKPSGSRKPRNVKPRTTPKPGRKLSTTVVKKIPYEIKDADGKLIAIHWRREFDDGHKDFRWERNGEWSLGDLPVEDLPLYGIEELAASDEMVFVTEGEGARDALKRLGLAAVATVTGGGRKCPCPATLASLAGRFVVLWPDNDGPGYDHMRLVADAFGDQFQEVGWVMWFDAFPKDDAADFAVAGGTADDVMEMVAWPQ